jgi:short-subunit dehydrogenase
MRQVGGTGREVRRSAEPCRPVTLPLPTPGRPVLVTGASAGIGAALAAELAARGHDLVLVARRAAELKRLARRLERREGVQVEVEPLDLVDARARAGLARRLERRDRPLAGLCNNAGVGGFGRFAEADRRKEGALIALNVVSLHALMAAAVPGMVREGSGAVLNVASILGHGAQPYHATYGASKAFVVSLSEAVSAELAGTGVSCTALSPGPVRTTIFETSGAGALEDIGPDLLWQEAEDVARAAVDGMETGARSVVPGAANQLAAAAWRFLPNTLRLPVQDALTAALPELRRRAGL